MKHKILFVCLGNICRSPTAEAVMKRLVADRGIDDDFYIDSAGTSGWHADEPADARMRHAGRQRGLDLTSLSRQVVPDDFEAFDYIVGMDTENMANLRKLDPLSEYTEKLHRMTDYCSEHDVNEVPDPYYGGPRGFDVVIDILEDACEGFLDKIESDAKANV